jgi:hypothetical protein
MDRMVNLTISQEQQLQYLYRVWIRLYWKKKYPLKPVSTTDFIELTKLHAEATSLVDKKILSQSLLAVAPDVLPPSSSSSSNLVNELAGVLTDLQQTIQQLHRPRTHSRSTRRA